MAMEPEACIAPPEGNGEPLEEVSGGRGRFRSFARIACAYIRSSVRTHAHIYAHVLVST